MKIAPIYVVLFILGLIVQFFLMISGSWEKDDFKKVMKSLGFGGLLGFLIAAELTEQYMFSLHILLACLISVGFFTIYFRKRLLNFISARTLIVMNLILLFIIFNKFGFNYWIFGILLVPSCITIINGFSDLNGRLSWQVFFRIWYLTLVAIIGSINFITTFQFFRNDYIDPTTSMITAFLLGGVFTYVISNVWYIFSIFKLITSKPIDDDETFNLNAQGLVSQSEYKRQLFVSKNKQLIADGYIWQPGQNLFNFLIIIIIPVFMAINYSYQLLPFRVVIFSLFLLMPILDNKLISLKKVEANT